LHRGFEKRGVQLCEKLSLLDFGVEIGVELGDGAGHLRPDLHRRNRGQCAGAGDLQYDVAAVDGPKEVCWLVRFYGKNS
jgi:hypothetical protein